MNKNSTFFERLEELRKAEGFKTINDLAINGLNYRSSQKLNRLKNGNNKPSAEIIEDIKNRFPHVDLNWLVSNKGEIYLPGTDFTVQEPEAPAPCRECILRDEIIATQKETIKALQDQANTLQLAMEIMSRRLVRKNGA
ncbi:MAG: helix-turn-helix transcriptional regulator [Niabella sp.]|nr:helix-turn-helix transcriptional regulator [Niabella sp.]